MLAVCDAVHAMSGNRCYRSGLAEPTIRGELASQSGRQFKATFVEEMLTSSLISAMSQLETSGKMVLTAQHIRQVLDETPNLENNELADAIDPHGGLAMVLKGFGGK